MPQPPVPADLEARLLATIPAEMPIPRRRWAIWAGVVGPLAAACLLAVFAWPRGVGNHPVPRSGTAKSQHWVTVPSPGTIASADAPGAGLPTPPTIRPSDNSAEIAAWAEARRVLNGAEPATFIWPIQEKSPITVSISIPADLLD
ncbi:MAG TPA: hypothetical protein VKA66_13520 [Mycobacterium sp.]|nr:hypothetical protein [Mycobacterium sp.]